ncbi:MAG: response regulator [Pseudomonadota bacterium]
MTEKQGKMKTYKKRFGVMAIEKGFITIEDLTKALEIQIQDEIWHKRHRLIGEVLLDEKIMSPEQIEEVVKAVSIEYGWEMPKKALVVDNDFFFVEFLSELLENRGYEVTKAYDGKEGVSKIEEDLYDVIFTDLVMPKIDGTELIKFARKKFLQGYFPVVAVSGVLKMQADRIQEIGATYYIEKGPMEEMKDKIDGFLERLEKEPFPDRMKDFSMEMEGLDTIQPMAELLETLDFHRAIMDCIGVGVILIDRDARIINANSLAFKILDRPLKDRSIILL